MGSSFIRGVFIAEPEELRKAIGKKTVYLNVLGNGNDISHVLKETDFSTIDTRQKDIDMLVDAMGDTIEGYNPLEHIVIEELEEI